MKTIVRELSRITQSPSIHSRKGHTTKTKKERENGTLKWRKLFYPPHHHGKCHTKVERGKKNSMKKGQAKILSDPDFPSSLVVCPSVRTCW